MPSRTRTVQITAVVSAETDARLDRLTRATGHKKAWVIETALRHHLLALEQLPADVIIPPRILVDRATGERLLERIETPSPPTPAMSDLFAE